MAKKIVKGQQQQKAAIKREQSQTCLNNAEREQTRPEVKKLDVHLRTVVNGYLLDVDGEGFMYFNAPSLIEGFLVHVGLERLAAMTREEIRDMLDSLKDGSAEKKLQAEVTSLMKQVDDLKKQVRNLKRVIKELEN